MAGAGLTCALQQRFVPGAPRGIWVRLGNDRPDLLDVVSGELVFNCSLQHKGLVSVVGKPRRILLGGEIGRCRRFGAGGDGLHFAFAISSPEPFCVVEVRGFGRGNPEQDTPYPIGRVTRGFDVAFSGSVGAHLVEREPLSFHVCGAYGYRRGGAHR